MDVCPSTLLRSEGRRGRDPRLLSQVRGLRGAAACPTEAIISPRLAPKNLTTTLSLQLRATRPPTPARAPLKRMLRAKTMSSSVFAWAILLPRPLLRGRLSQRERVPAVGRVRYAATPVAIFWRGHRHCRGAAGTGMGLSMTPRALNVISAASTSARSTWISIARTTGLTVTKLNPATAARPRRRRSSKSTATRLPSWSARSIPRWRHDGKTSPQLTHGRQLVLRRCKPISELAQNMQVSTPECDFDKCTSWRMRQRVPHVCLRFGGSGRFALESTYCPAAEPASRCCPEHALAG